MAGSTAGVTANGQGGGAKASGARNPVKTGRVTKRSQIPKTQIPKAQANTLRAWATSGSASSPAPNGDTGEESTEPVSHGAVYSTVRLPSVGQPPAWAESRPAICETLGWFRSSQGGCYQSGFCCYGFLLDADSGDRAYIDEEVVITRLGGGCDKDAEGNLRQNKDHEESSALLKAVRNTMDLKVPVGLIIGNRNELCPSVVPHKYNVMAFFQITHLWYEKVGKAKGARIRLEKIDLDEQSWWAPQGAPPPVPLSQRDGVTPAIEPDCSTCSASSPQVYSEGWMCLNRDCAQFFTINNRTPTALTYSPGFLSMRHPHDGLVRAQYSLAPGIAAKFSNFNPLGSTAHGAWRGIVCPLCKRCISRIYWRGWKCETEGCGFEHVGRVQAIPLQSVLQDTELGGTGHRMPYFGKDAKMSPTSITYMKNYRKDIFVLPDVGVVTHFSANMTVNSRPGGPNDLFQQLQELENLGLRRYPLAQSFVADTLTCHFAVNYGMPYKYVVDVDALPFSAAPDVLLAALGRLTWATQETVPEGEFQKPNELLTLGYFEKMSIGYHDDGEDSLGPTIATLSLGASAKMSIRMKEKYFKGHSKSNVLTKDDPVLPGSALYDERAELQRQHRAGELTKAAYDTGLKELLKKMKSKKPTALIVMEVHHGDLVVMHGENLQRYYEHKVVPEGDVRFALTSRYVKPSEVPESDHHKGDFTQKPEFEYDGDE